MNFEYILNNILTSGVDLADPDILRKYRALNIFQLTMVLLSPVLGLFYFYIGAFPLFYTLIAAGMLMFVGVMLLRVTRNLVFAGNYTLVVMWSVIAVVSWKTGAISYDGIINPTWMLNAGLILFAIFLNGYLSGSVWAIIIFIQTGLLIALFRKGYEFSSILKPEIADTYFMGVYLLCLLIILLFAFLFEKEKSDALMREQNKSKTIREAKKYMDNIFDRYPLPTFVLDRRHRVIQWNRASSDISGLSPEEVLGKEVWEGFHMSGQGKSMADIMLDDISSLSDLYKEDIVSSDKGWFEVNTCLEGVSGGLRATITAAPILGDDGSVRGAIQTIQEVKQIPVEAGAQDYLADFFPKATFKVDAKGKINFWNRACTRLLGHDYSYMLGQSPLSIVAKSDRDSFKNIFVKTIKGETFPDHELTFISASGKAVYVIARVFPCHNSLNNAVECVFINTDITPLQIKLKKLRQLASESNEKYKELSEEYDLMKKNLATFIRKKDNSSER